MLKLNARGVLSTVVEEKTQEDSFLKNSEGAGNLRGERGS